MCGPSNQEEQLAASESSFSKLLSANYAQNFGAQSQVMSQLNNLWTPIAEAGPDQQGFGPQQLAALQTQAGEGVGQNYAKATQALGDALAARGGGSEFLPTGAESSLRGGLAASAANQMSQEQLAITQANYAQGRQNWQGATAGLQALGQEYNPNAIAGQATSATGQAFGEANQIQQQQNQKEAGIAGGIASLITGPIGGFLGGGISNVLSGGAQAGSETGGGAEQFFSGGLSGLGYGQ